MERPYRDREWLEYQYHERGLTQREIGELCGVSPRTIRTYMKEFGIETRDVEGENHGLYGKERNEEVRKQISETLSGRDFSDESRRRMSKALTGKTIPGEVRKKISESLEGVQKSDETRKRMSESKLGPILEYRQEYHWAKLAYGRGFRHAKTTVRRRDEVCQVCGTDGSQNSLSVHHIVPLRYIVDSADLRYQDAHPLGNLVLVCQSCHPKVEWGDIDIEPNFNEIPDDHRTKYRQLWEEYIRQKHSVGKKE